MSTKSSIELWVSHWPDDLYDDADQQPDVTLNLDGEYLSPDPESLYYTPFSPRHLYLQELCDAVPRINDQLNELLDAKSDSDSMENILQEWARKCHLDKWMIEPLIAEYGCGWPRAERWYEAKCAAEEAIGKQIAEEWIESGLLPAPSGPKIEAEALFQFQLTYRVDPFVERFVDARRRAQHQFDVKWAKLENEIRAQAKKEGWRENIVKRKREPTVPLRHFAWVARYQSGEEHYSTIEASPDAPGVRVEHPLRPGTVGKAVRRLAAYLGIALRPAKRGRPRKKVP
jgi:hypothetical protein